MPRGGTFLRFVAGELLPLHRLLRVRKFVSSLPRGGIYGRQAKAFRCVCICCAAVFGSSDSAAIAVQQRRFFSAADGWRAAFATGVTGQAGDRRILWDEGGGPISLPGKSAGPGRAGLVQSPG